MDNNELYNGLYVEDLEDEEMELGREYYNREHSGIFLYDMVVGTGKVALYTMLALVLSCIVFAITTSV